MEENIMLFVRSFGFVAEESDSSMILKVRLFSTPASRLNFGLNVNSSDFIEIEDTFFDDDDNNNGRKNII